MISVQDLRQIVARWPTQNTNGYPTCVFMAYGYPELRLPPEPVSCFGRVSSSDASLVFAPADKAIPCGSTGDTAGALNLALAAIKTLNDKTKLSLSLTHRAITAITNVNRLENLAQLPYACSVNASGINDSLTELDLIASQAEAIVSNLGRLVRSQQVNPNNYTNQLHEITCRLETAASFIRAILPLT